MNIKKKMGSKLVPKPQLYLGITLTIIGLGFSLVSYLIIHSIPLTAIGLSTIILGVTSIGLAYTRPVISVEACYVFLQPEIENTTDILEVFRVTNKAIYLPRDIDKVHNKALIPLSGDCDFKTISGELYEKLVVKYKPDLITEVIAVTTLGNVSLDLLQKQPGPTTDEIKSAMTYILSNVLDIAKGVKVSLEDSKINVEVIGANIHCEDASYYYYCLGSPVASIAAAISSEALQKPMRIVEESNQKGIVKIILEVLS